jgi:ribosome-binding protein aMBF1 (putative translation factor)
MTAARLNAALEAIGWGQTELARRLGADTRLVRRWATGERPVPPLVADWLDSMCKLVASNPVPAWKRRG